ncbi:Sul-3 [Aphelenchoides besseyi]|nr:Sul-3 [Aphelenchoides besseyi]
MTENVLSFLLFSLLHLDVIAKSQPPNILLILADDLGHADLDWHDSRLHTPNLRALAFSQSSVYLKGSYVNQLCTPTRSALMTGYYPFRTGTQRGVFLNMEASGVPMDYSFLPQNLKKLGYQNYLIGKWHLGYCRREFLPTARGFDYFYGYYGPQEGYFNHSTDLYDRNTRKVVGGLDFFREVNGRMHPIVNKNGVYSTHLFNDEAIRVLETHPRNQPFFLFLSYQAVHAPLQVPSSYQKFCTAFAHDYRRMIYCAMLAAMDESIGKVVRKLEKLGLLNNTLIAFSSDNGGDTTFGASNFPYRGEKNTLFEGGTKTVTFFHFKKEFSTFRNYTDLFHVVDWHPTLLGVAGGSALLYGDGINQWPAITQTGTRRLRRTQFIYNIDSPASAIRRGDYKLIYESSDVLHNAGRARLFNLKLDPNETNDIARKNPKLVAELLNRLRRFATKSRQSVRTPMDPRGNPIHFGGVFNGNWC